MPTSISRFLLSLQFEAPVVTRSGIGNRVYLHLRNEGVNRADAYVSEEDLPFHVIISRSRFPLDTPAFHVIISRSRFPLDTPAFSRNHLPKPFPRMEVVSLMEKRGAVSRRGV
jgi:hypothetical protein